MQSNKRRALWFVVGAALLVALAFLTAGGLPSTAVAMQAATPAPTTAAPAGAGATTAITPTLPAPVAVQLDPKTTAYLVLDVTSTICEPRKSCMATLSAVASLLKKARDAQVFVAYSDTPGTSTIIVGPAANEPKVTGRADKFFGTKLDDLLKEKGIKTVVIVGYVANGAVLYTAFGANIRGYTVVVAEDGTGAEDPFALLLTRYQLLNEPGFNNPTNAPLVEGRVTLSRSDLITFVPGAPGPKPLATAQPAATTAATGGPTAAATKAPATAAPTVAATTAPTVAPTVGPTAAASPAAAGSAVCLGCHVWADVMKKSADYTSPDGVKVNPHTFIDTSASKPHSTGKGIPDCTNCHTAHPLPPPPASQIPKGDVEYCFSACHHQRNFTPCTQCH